MIRRWLLSLCLLAHAAYAPAQQAETSGMSYLDNGVIRLGMNLEIGGAITWLSESGSDENLVNSHDWGRQIQMSFYSGPTPYEPDGKKPHPSWTFIGWNPIQSGDCYDNPSQVLAHENYGETAYVKCIPMHWPLDNEPGECSFEVWATLEGNTVRVRSRLTNARGDTTQYTARGQELPAVYTNGPYYRLFTYTGDAPFTGDDLYRVEKIWDTRIPPAEAPGGPWEGWFATENWAALLNEDDWGLGIWSPGSYQYTGGFAGEPGSGGPKDSPTGYFAPLRREILDHDIVYEYEYTLILGTLGEIREFVYENAPRPTPPSYAFAQDREGWTLHNAHDGGWQLDGEWRVELSGERPALSGPLTLWEAKDMPIVRIRAAFNTGEDTARLRWERLGPNGPEHGGEVEFPVTPDGETHDHAIDLSKAAGYDGYCMRLTVMPAREGGEGKSVVVERVGKGE